MSIYFCEPSITLSDVTEANEFLKYCQMILKDQIAEIIYISSINQINQLLVKSVNKNDIFIFFNSLDGQYDDKICKLVKKFHDNQCRIWPIAMDKNPECRKPPEPATEKQSFDVYCRKENRNPLNNNMRAIAQIFARKIVAQTLSPLYKDEVLYFISHRRIDGEHITAKLADELKLLTRERNVYRDVVNVAVGEDAQKDIDENLAKSDVVIFIQTEQAQYSDFIMKELCYALVNDIPVLWVQIDNASYAEMPIRPGENPVLNYLSADFDIPNRLEEIADEIEENCFNLIMNSSNQVYSYIECLEDMNNTSKIELTYDNNSLLAYSIKYKEKTRDRYASGEHLHYIQCFGRNPQLCDVEQFEGRIKASEILKEHERFFLLSNRGEYKEENNHKKILNDNYDNYLANIENALGIRQKKLNKRIIISGAFPDSDEIYKNSLIEALVVYSREIIKGGYTLVFGAHPTFQRLIFDIGRLFADDIKYSIEMHMDKAYIEQYDKDELEEQCTLILADGLQEMRENMICKNASEMLICLGGKIKDDKSQQGVDVEVGLAKSAGIPVALVGTVGGRSSEYAYEVLTKESWSEVNDFGKALNEGLFYNVNHRLMVKKLMDYIERENKNEL